MLFTEIMDKPITWCSAGFPSRIVLLNQGLYVCIYVYVYTDMYYTHTLFLYNIDTDIQCCVSS